ncbi:MAG TPA: SGNH/GDSL hydrolase family protein [Polyangiaceae bacterium]|nr:SGNH/GDSL hydrolase family protein [Polyangiaceae bacterium]
MNRTSCLVLVVTAVIAGCGAPAPGGGTGGAGGGAGSGGNTCPRSSVNGSQVVFVGDSFLAAPTSNIAPELERLWQAAGSAGYSPTPRYHQFVATNMAQIAGQYDAARAANPDIKVVIANGGGNDVLILDRSCLTQAPPGNAGCTTTINNSLATAGRMLTKMVSDGVQNVVFFFYPHEPTSGIFQGNAPAINATLDYAEPLARQVCERHPICTFVSLREATGDAPGSGYTERGLINPLDVHPSAKGSQFFAQAIWNAMKSRCILSP